MCAVCRNKGYVREAIPKNGIPDRAVHLKQCPECKGIGSELELALKPVGLTVTQYFFRSRS